MSACTCRNTVKRKDKDRGSLELGGEKYLLADLARPNANQMYGSVVSKENVHVGRLTI